MCFSAPASFIASGGLAALGGASLIVAKKEEKVLALIPIFFAVQQAFEGVQWLYLNHGPSCAVAGYGFLFFSSIVWPFYVPLAVFIVDKKKRPILKWFVFLGACVSLFFVILFVREPVSIYTVNMSIRYQFADPWLIDVAYFVVVLVPMLISSRRFLRWFALMAMILACVAGLFYFRTFVSVWCFFAAVVSSLFFFHLKRKNRL